MSPGVTPFFCNGQIVTIAGFVGHTVQLQLRNSGVAVYNFQCYVWVLKFEFHIILLCHKRLNFFFPIIIQPLLSSMQKQASLAQKYVDFWMSLSHLRGRRILSKFLLSSSPPLCLLWHCAITGLCLFLLSKDWDLPLQPPSLAYSRCLLNTFQMNGVVIIALAGQLCLPEALGSYCFILRVEHLFG